MPRLESPFTAKTDRWLRIAGPFGLFITGIFFFKLKMYLELPQGRLPTQVAIALSCGYIGWELTRFTVLTIQSRLPGLQRTKQRIVSMAISLIVLAHVGVTIRVIAQILFNDKPLKLPSLQVYSDTTGLLLFYTTVILVIYETAYVIGQWKKTAGEKEKLLRSEWQAKYDLLKAQINPHFLFNSLNTLSSLITEDPARAEQFANEMSRMYRYLLKSNDQEQVTLGDELRFIKSYGHLLSVRYGDAIQISVDVDEQHHNYLIPGLTLQLLVENAVKHNAILKDTPLNIRIYSNDKGLLVVENNLQKKKTLVHSTGMGLKNIKEKFRLLHTENIQVDESEGYFKVSVPLIATETSAQVSAQLS